MCHSQSLEKPDRTAVKKTRARIDGFISIPALSLSTALNAQRDDPNSFILMIIRSHEVDSTIGPHAMHRDLCAVTVDTQGTANQFIVSKTNTKMSERKRNRIFGEFKTHVKTSNHHQCTSWSPTKIDICILYV